MNVLKTVLGVALVMLASLASAQDRPTIEIDVTGGNIRPVPTAVPQFVAETNGAQLRPW